MADQNRLFDNIGEGNMAPLANRGIGHSGVNRFLNNRMMGRFDAQSAPRGYGGDTDMMDVYGPEDQVAYDPGGKPIPLADPNHPRNLGRTNSLIPMLQSPQQRR